MLCQFFPVVSKMVLNIKYCIKVKNSSIVATLGWHFTPSNTCVAPWLRRGTSYCWTHRWQQCRSSSGWGWSERLYWRRPLSVGKASWWRGSGPDSLPHSCLGHRPEPACGLQRANRQRIILQCPPVTLLLLSGNTECFGIVSQKYNYSCLPSSSTAMTAAPLLNNTCTTVARPFLAAMWRGLHETERNLFKATISNVFTWNVTGADGRQVNTVHMDNFLHADIRVPC